MFVEPRVAEKKCSLPPTSAGRHTCLITAYYRSLVYMDFAVRERVWAL
jgi:hypothetical protein